MNLLCEHLTGRVLDWIARSSDERRIGAGEILVAEGQKGDTLYVLLEGVFDLVMWGGPHNPAKEFMDYVLDWKLIHRTEADMNRLFSGSAFRTACSRIRFEEGGINLFAECRREGEQVQV